MGAYVYNMYNDMDSDQGEYIQWSTWSGKTVNQEEIQVMDERSRGLGSQLPKGQENDSLDLQGFEVVGQWNVRWISAG